MTKHLIMAGWAAGLLAATLAVPSPGVAQGQTGEIVVFGADPCPRSTDDQVVICRRLPETERYRIPEKYQRGATFQERQSWVNKARTLQNIGATGVGSCSAVGPGGYTGCLTQEIEQARREQREQAEQAAPPED